MRQVLALAAAVLLTGAAAPQRGVVSGISVSPAKNENSQAVTAAVTGTNPCGAVHIDWGDGTAITYAIVDVPVSQRHTYDKAGSYTVVARGMGNCDGSAKASLQIDPAPKPPEPRARLQAIEVAPNPATAPAAVGITVRGTGTCTYVLDFGDGNSDRRTAALPETVKHTYPAPNAHYAVAAKGEGACEGLVRSPLRVNAAPAADEQRRLTKVAVEPNPAAARYPVTVIVDGRGRCAVTVDFGDGADQRIETTLPARVTHTYWRAGLYEIYAWADAPCGGDGEVTLRVRGGRR
jgi:hypothetical protein